MEIAIGLAAFAVCLTLIWSFRIMSDALARLTASVAAIGADVSGIADAIRNHINSDSGISQTALNALADQLDEAGAKLKDLETGLDAPASDVPSEPAPPASDGGLGEPAAPAAEPAPPAQPDLAVTPGDLPPAGNQNGIGSDFANRGDDGSSLVPPSAEPGSEPPIE